MDILLPDTSGHMIPYHCAGRLLPHPSGIRFKSRIAYAAAHVVGDPLGTIDIANP